MKPADVVEVPAQAEPDFVRSEILDLEGAG
jgi:hypothetical protein